jgi:SAM-dependent methyltransferase
VKNILDVSTASPHRSGTIEGLPVTGEAVVDEITRFTGLPRADVSFRVWMEALELGWNVNQEVRMFGATPHEYNQEMEALYREGSSFIFETLVYWCRVKRQRWSEHAFNRVSRHAAGLGVPVSKLSILLLGDGAGNDAIYFSRRGCNVDYFDIPGSRTSEFAMKRFAHYGLLANGIHPVEEYGCLEKMYDVVMSFEVLEHLVDPISAIRDFARLLRIGGIALVTEAFGGVHDYLPTHLRSNEKFSGKTAFLHLQHNLKLSWYSSDPLFKPMEFVRVERRQLSDYVALIGESEIAKCWLRARVRRLVRGMRALAR